MGPYYELDDITKQRIFDFISACEHTALGNLQFEYYEDDEVRFYLAELKDTWQVTVSVRPKGERDIYLTKRDKLEHIFSEKD